MRVSLFQHDETFEAHASGDVVFRQGDAGDRMYAVKDLIDREPRSATARAATACQIVAIDERRFAFLVQQTPMFALQVMKTVVGRLRRRLAAPA